MIPAPLKRLIRIIGLILTLVGGGLFIFPHYVSYYLSPSFEWPLLQADNIITTADGLHAVPLVRCQRIQLYDADWQFLRSWYVASAGGDFHLVPLQEKPDGIVVETARGRLLIRYDLHGRELSRETLAGSYYPPQKTGESRTFSSSWWLLPLHFPFIAWVIAIIGMIAFYHQRILRSAFVTEMTEKFFAKRR